VLELKLFGHSAARYQGQVLDGFPNQQPWLLLCYLVMNRGRLLPREQISTMFWSDEPTDTSLKRLRGTLWRLRSLLKANGVPPDDYLTVKEGSLGFAPEVSYYVDAHAFEATAALYQHTAGRDLSADAAAELAQAVELYAGELLEGVYEDWCLIERERLSIMYITSLSKLASFHEANGTYEKGLAYAASILALDETREMIHRQMMRLYWFMGDRSRALLQYKQCTQILRTALQVAPMEETTRLYEKILRESVSTLGPASKHTPASHLERQDESTQMLVEHAVRSAQRLRSTLDQASAELRKISNLLDALQSTPIDAETDAERRLRDGS
jgi:DNA-binding SARP family transcriptional activator